MGFNQNKFTFNKHVCKLCKKASNKLHTLARISKYITKDKLKTNECLFPTQLAYLLLV